jgi:aminoglycoside 3-N-acetyltransferase
MPDLSFRELVNGFRKLGISPERPVIAHASVTAFGGIHGGAQTLLGALLSQYPSLVVPTFTYKTMITPEQGPENNALQYGTSRDLNVMAEFFRPTIRADRLMGILPELLRCHPQAQRSIHPILSFAGINASPAISAQTLDEPLAPIRVLHELGGWVMLLGVNHTVNTSIHYGELLGGRRQFLRWALTPVGILACPGFPGCSDGFEAMAKHMGDCTRQAAVGQAWVQAVPMDVLVERVQAVVRADPLALLCDRSYCERCTAVRAGVSGISG